MWKRGGDPTSSPLSRLCSIPGPVCFHTAILQQENRPQGRLSGSPSPRVLVAHTSRRDVPLQIPVDNSLPGREGAWCCQQRGALIHSEVEAISQFSFLLTLLFASYRGDASSVRCQVHLPSLSHHDLRHETPDHHLFSEGTLHGSQLL